MPEEDVTGTESASEREQTHTEPNADVSGDARQVPLESLTENPPPNDDRAHARKDASERERQLTPPPENWIVIDQALPRFNAAGLPIKLRTMRKYCLNGKLRCTLAVTDRNTFKYFVDPASIEEFIAREAQKTPTESDDVEPVRIASATDAPGRASVRDDYGVYEHPYVKRLEREIDDYKHKYDFLQAAARADLIKLHETYAVAQSETLAKYLLLEKGKVTSPSSKDTNQQSTF